MPRVIHFEIHADNPERAVAFYRDIFGWEFTKWGGPVDYWLIKTGPDGTPGINGGLIRRQGPAPAGGQAVNAYACTIDTPNLDQFVQKVTEKGGVIVVPNMPIPGVGWLAYATDSEGNIFGMMQSDVGAK
ncbi:MAG: VOC family protein [Gemmataceae bacterium]|nr:VOC family protein [Gemmataceae bacterium]